MTCRITRAQHGEGDTFQAWVQNGGFYWPVSPFLKVLSSPPSLALSAHLAGGTFSTSNPSPPPPPSSPLRFCRLRMARASGASSQSELLVRRPGSLAQMSPFRRTEISLPHRKRAPKHRDSLSPRFSFSFPTVCAESVREVVVFTDERAISEVSTRGRQTAHTAGWKVGEQVLLLPRSSSN